ncbi:MAG: acyltransferase family protein [Pseudonocardiaceae bacterium]
MTTAPAAPAELRTDPRAPLPMKDRIVFVDIGRGSAALLVVYTHINMVWMYRDHGISTAVTDAVSTAFANPLHLADVGLLAVPFFFLASGFVITPMALRQGYASFAVNRLFRIYPLLALAILLTAGALLVGLNPIATDQQGPVTPITVLTNISLLNYIIYPQVVLLSVAWTLIVEMIFYLMVMLLLPVFRRAPWLAVAIQLTLIEVVMVTRAQFGPSYSLFAFNMLLTTLPIIGQIIWLGFTRRISGLLAGIYIGIAWWLYVWAKELEVGNIEPGYPTAVAVVIMLFLLGLLAEPYLRQRQVWTVLSERTYSIYLMHGITSFIVLDALYGLVPLWIAVVIAVAATAATAEITYRFVEVPSRSLGRSLARSLRQRARAER